MIFGQPRFKFLTRSLSFMRCSLTMTIFSFVQETHWPTDPLYYIEDCWTFGWPRFKFLTQSLSFMRRSLTMTIIFLRPSAKKCHPRHEMELFEIEAVKKTLSEKKALALSKWYYSGKVQILGEGQKNWKNFHFFLTLLGNVNT